MSGLTANEALRAPFPWYGGKRRVARQVWDLLGACDRYVEPFAGSLGVLFGRPTPFRGLEVVNDLDGYIVNAWRAIKHAPDEVARHAIDLVSELDLTARHLYLVNEGADMLRRYLAALPEWYDARIAGWWIQGVSSWIGTGFCSGRGPWTREKILGENTNDDAIGVNRQLPQLNNDGRGINRQLPFLNKDAQGINRRLIDDETLSQFERARLYLEAISKRIERVVVTTGDWSRVVTTSALGGTTPNRIGIFLDPPYRQHGDEYAIGNNNVEKLWVELEAWAETIDQARTAVVVCGYHGDFNAPDDWLEIAYTAKGTSSDNKTRERFWASPLCQTETRLF